MIISLLQLNFKEREREIVESVLFLNTNKIISFKRKTYTSTEGEVLYTSITCEDNKFFYVAEKPEEIMAKINKAEAGK